MARARTAAGRRLGEAARQRGRRAAADQHARREVRRALRPDRHGPHGPARGRRPHPAVPQRPQPGDRGGAVRALRAAQRRRSGPAQDDHRGAEQGPGRPGEPGQIAAQGTEHLHRRPGRPAEGHRPRPRGRRPARGAARQGEEDDRPGRRHDATCSEGPGRPAPRSDEDAHRPVEAGHDGHQGGQRLARRHGREPQTAAAHPATAEQGGRRSAQLTRAADHLPVPAQRGGRRQGGLRQPRHHGRPRSVRPLRKPDGRQLRPRQGRFPQATHSRRTESPRSPRSPRSAERADAHGAAEHTEPAVVPVAAVGPLGRGRAAVPAGVHQQLHHPTRAARGDRPRARGADAEGVQP